MENYCYFRSRLYGVVLNKPKTGDAHVDGNEGMYVTVQHFLNLGTKRRLEINFTLRRSPLYIEWEAAGSSGGNRKLLRPAK